MILAQHYLCSEVFVIHSKNMREEGPLLASSILIGILLVAFISAVEIFTVKQSSFFAKIVDVRDASCFVALR